MKHYLFVTYALALAIKKMAISMSTFHVCPGIVQSDLSIFLCFWEQNNVLSNVMNHYLCLALARQKLHLP